MSPGKSVKDDVGRSIGAAIPKASAVTLGGRSFHGLLITFESYDQPQLSRSESTFQPVMFHVKEMRSS